MTHLIHWFPELDHRALPVERKKRKRIDIPGMQDEKGAHRCKHPDSFVIEIILNHLRTGQYKEALSEIYGVEPNTIEHWLDGTNRRRCYNKAMEIYRDELKPRT